MLKDVRPAKTHRLINALKSKGYTFISEVKTESFVTEKIQIWENIQTGVTIMLECLAGGEGFIYKQTKSSEL